MFAHIAGQKFNIVSLAGVDALSDLYSFELVIHSRSKMPVSGLVHISDGKQLKLQGEIASVKTSYRQDLIVYQLRLVSPLSKFHRSAHNRLFEQISPIEVIQKLDLPIINHSSKQSQEQHYIVQYEQTDLEFFCCLVLRSGLGFTYQDENIVLFDSIDQLKRRFDNVLVYDYGQTDEFMLDRCLTIDKDERQSFYAKVYDFTQAEQATTLLDPKSSPLPSIKYNGVPTEELLQRYSNLRNDNSVQITTKHFIRPGTKFDLLIWGEKHNYIAVSVSYCFNGAFSNVVTAVKTDNYRHIVPTLARFPKSHVQLGRVVDGVDQWGRIRVQFMWGGDQDIAWVRVAQQGSTSSGRFCLPRIGDEVLIDFENGDVERPIVIGSLINSSNVIDHDPTQKDISYWKMSKTDKPEEMNKISFDASPEASLITIHACQDMETQVENNMRATITRGDFSFENKEGDFIQILEKGNSDTALKEGNYKVALEKGNMELAIKGNYSLESEKTLLRIKDDCEQTMDKNCSIKVERDMNLSINTGNYVIKLSSGKLTIDAVEILGKAQKVSIKAAADLTLEGMNVNIKAAMGVKIEGTTVECKGGATAKMTAGAALQLEGSGITEIKGGIVKIN